MKPENPLPYNTAAFKSTEAYVDSLIDLVSTNELLRTLCGGVHILDFFTQEPDLYSQLLPQEWRDCFSHHEIMDLLDLFMREDLTLVAQIAADGSSWRNGPTPPESLLDYLNLVRKHLLIREPNGNQCTRNRTQKKLSRHVSVGMSVKKVHEVGLFASYIDTLANQVSASLPNGEEISHLVDFGSGQSYLGRALASEPYNRNIVAVESKSHNAERARAYDVAARIAQKDRVLRNKKAFRAGLVLPDLALKGRELPMPPPEIAVADGSTGLLNGYSTGSEEGKGRIQHIEHRIENGDLTSVIAKITPGQLQNDSKKNLLVISLHSCGNLVHHGLRSLILNPAVKAVAMVGCCYNLLTERLGPPTYKHPILRPNTSTTPATTQPKKNPSSSTECTQGDPHGFPISTRLSTSSLNLNITARMMAVQAPSRWGEKDSDSFLTRHFYRAVLQRIFLDHDVVSPPTRHKVEHISPLGHSSSGGTPILIGSLRAGSYDSSTAYVRAALEKLQDDVVWGDVMKEKMGTLSDEVIAGYDRFYAPRKKTLSVVWCLMAFSAGVVEAAIVLDRWLWLGEQDCVAEAWVESVWDYGVSPRNLVVVGVKKGG